MTSYRSNDGLHHDEPRKNHIQHCKDYVAKVDSKAESASTSSTAIESACPLTTIRRNCLHNASLRLSSCEVPKTRSLLSYARQSRFPTRSFPSRSLPKLVKLVQTSKQEIDLTSSTQLFKEAVSVSFNCNLCPLLAEEGNRGRKNVKDFLDEPISGDDETEMDGAAAGASSSSSLPSSSSSSSSGQRAVFVDPMLGSFNVHRFV